MIIDGPCMIRRRRGRGEGGAGAAVGPQPGPRQAGHGAIQDGPR